MERETYFNPVQRGLYFLPLGGSCHIGGNCNVYACDGEQFLVDLGIGFSDKPGVEVMVPYIKYLIRKEVLENLVGIFITHIHEDHCGALPYLIQYLRVITDIEKNESRGIKIYASRFCFEFLKRKFDKNKPTLIEGRAFFVRLVESPDSIKSSNKVEEDLDVIAEEFVDSEDEEHRENLGEFEIDTENFDHSPSDNERRNGAEKRRGKTQELVYEIHVIEDGQSLKIGKNFEVDFYNLPHSCPEMMSAHIKTSHGSIFHTGDWKFDGNPVLGEPANFAKLKQLGDQGVTALVCDSTNVMVPGSSGFEGSVVCELENVIVEANRRGVRVIISLFTSNVARMHTIMSLAVKHGRIVGLVGRAVCRVTAAALDAGYLADFPEETRVGEADISNYATDRSIIICTGCQGETKAALTKIVNNAHRHVKLRSDDIVVFSAKVIPGNEKRVNALLNELTRIGCTVVTPDTHKIHVSGHPASDEVKKMYELIRPQISIPVHGEIMHTRAHKKLVEENNLAQMCQIVSDGDVIKISQNRSEKIAEVEAGVIYVDGHRFRTDNDGVFAARERMNSHGLLVMLVQVFKNSARRVRRRFEDDGPACRVQIFAPGLIDLRALRRQSLDDSFLEVLKIRTDKIVTSMNMREREWQSDLRKRLVLEARSLCDLRFGKRPEIKVFVCDTYGGVVIDS